MTLSGLLLIWDRVIVSFWHAGTTLYKNSYRLYNTICPGECEYFKGTGVLEVEINQRLKNCFCNLINEPTWIVNCFIHKL